MKSSLSIVLVFELAFAIWLSSTMCTLRPAFLDAARAVHQHPSSEAAAAEFRHQQFLSSIMPYIVGTCFFGALAVPTAGLAALRHRRAARLSSRQSSTTTPAA